MIHPETKRQLDSLQRSLPGAVLLQGSHGVGLQYAAKKLAEPYDTLLLTPQSQKDSNPENGTISIETIRELYTDTRSRRKTPLVIIVDDADRMSPGAANAFLKLLEEPNSFTHFILTSHRPQLLPATIRSRTQRIEVLPITSRQTEDLLRTLVPDNSQKRAQMVFIAERYPAELHRLANNEAYFEQQAALAKDAKLLLEGVFEDQLKLIASYQTSEKARQLSTMLLLILRRLISRQPTKKNIEQLDRVLTLDDALTKNGNTRLQLLRLIV